MRSNRPPLIVSFGLLVVGVALLLQNYLLLDFNVLRLWPLLLIVGGAQLLWRGDIGLTWQGQTFGITRGNVQSAHLEASSGELDMKIRALRREGRLIAGQYTARSRPMLGVRGSHARLSMQRGQTWLLSLADWEIGLARDLPWNVLLSAYLGDVDVDLRGLTVERAYIGTGIGDVRVVAPDEGIRQDGARPTALHAQSTFGNLTLVIPPDVVALVRVQPGAAARLQIDETRFLQVEPGLYATLGYTHGQAVPFSATLASAFGIIRLS